MVATSGYSRKMADVEQREVASLLAARCARRQPAAVLAAKGRIICEATLAELGETLRVEVFGASARQLRSQAIVCLIFSDDTVAHTFYARIVSYRRATLDGPAQLELEQPERIAVVPAPSRRVTRHSFRVPLFDGETLEVDLTFEGLHAARARVLDLSLGGLLLELLGEELPTDVRVGSALHVVLEHDDLQLKEWAEVRTIAGNELGVRFPSFGEGADLDPPPAYARLAARLERTWLRQRHTP